MSEVAISWEVPKVFKPLLSRKRYLGVHGGRGSGKSHFFAAMIVARMLEGVDCLCVREVQNSIADSVKKLIEEKINAFGIASWFHITEREIRCKPTGAICIFRGLQTHTAASIKSLEGFGFCWVEEAQTISQSSLNLLLPTIRRPQSQVAFSWNPVREEDPIDTMLRKEGRDNAVVVEANWSDNPWFPEGLKDDMERDKQREPDKYLHIWEGKYQAMSEARIFRNWKIEDLDHKLHDRLVWFYGVDFGFAQDPTAVVRCCMIGDRTLYIDHEAWQIGVPNEALPKLLHNVPGVNLWPSRADSARPETIDYLRRNGFPKMRPAKKGKGSVEDGISFLQGLDIVVHPRCANMKAELASYAYKIDKHTQEILPIPEDDHNHLIDGLRYACERMHVRGKLVSVVERDTIAQSRPNDYGGPDYDNASDWKVA